MCEERVVRSEKLALKYQHQFEASQAQGVKWKKDRQDIGNYALTLEKALKKAHNVIESLKRTRTTNVQLGMQPMGDNSINATKVPRETSVGVVHEHTAKHPQRAATLTSTKSHFYYQQREKIFLLITVPPPSPTT